MMITRSSCYHFTGQQRILGKINLHHLHPSGLTLGFILDLWSTPTWLWDLKCKHPCLTRSWQQDYCRPRHMWIYCSSSWTVHLTERTLSWFLLPFHFLIYLTLLVLCHRFTWKKQKPSTNKNPKNSLYVAWWEGGSQMRPSLNISHKCHGIDNRALQNLYPLFPTLFISWKGGVRCHPHNQSIKI